MWAVIYPSTTKTFINSEKEALRNLLKSKLKDPKIVRYLNFRDLALMEVCFQLSILENNFSRLRVDPERNGIFTAVNNTQLSDFYPYFEPCFDCLDVDENSGKKKFNSAIFGGEILDKINPNVAITALVNNGLAQASREFEIRGASSCFYDPFIGSSNALKYAYHKLKMGSLDKAWVVGSFEEREPFDLGQSDGTYISQSSALSVSNFSPEFRFEQGLEFKFIRNFYLRKETSNLETALVKILLNFQEEEIISPASDSILFFSQDLLLNRKFSKILEGQLPKMFLDTIFSKQRFEFLWFINKLFEFKIEGRLLVIISDEFGLLHTWLFGKT